MHRDSGIPKVIRPGPEVAARLQRRSEGFLDEAQCGFRKGRGVDDVLQVSRRLVEEICRGKDDHWASPHLR